MKNNIKLSFITATYNDEKFFDGWIKDLVKQTIFHECEIIFVDCNSKENESKMIQPWIEKYPNNIRLFSLSHDKGLYNAWNAALQNCNGKYITNASMDDRRSSEFAEKLTKFLDENEDIDVVYTENYTTSGPNETFENNSSNGNVYNAAEFSFQSILTSNPPHVMPMWRASIHDKVGGFLESYPSCSDYEFWLRCAFMGIKFKKYDERLGLYYHNPKGLSTNPENDSWKLLDENYVRNSYTEFFLTNMHRGYITNEYFFNWWESRDWRTHKKDFPRE